MTSVFLQDAGVFLLFAGEVSDGAFSQSHTQSGIILIFSMLGLQKAHLL